MKRSTFYSFTVIFSLVSVLSLGACAQTTPANEIDEAQGLLVVTDTPQNVSDDCVYPNGSPDPIGQSIAETYLLTYDEVMTWYCDGYTYDDIMIALETSAAVDVSVDDLLSRLEEKTWEEIWVEIGFTSNN